LLFIYHTLYNTNNGHQSTTANASAGQVLYNATNVHGCSSIYATTTQHTQQLTAESATQDTGN
jgi:hypothetical protein